MKVKYKVNIFEEHEEKVQERKKHNIELLQFFIVYS